MRVGDIGVRLSPRGVTARVFSREKSGLKSRTFPPGRNITRSKHSISTVLSKSRGCFRVLVTTLPCYSTVSMSRKGKSHRKYVRSYAMQSNNPPRCDVDMPKGAIVLWQLRDLGGGASFFDSTCKTAGKYSIEI